MAFHSKKDFAAMCGIKTKDLSVYIGRKKVIVKNDLIDDADQINQVFHQKISAKKATKAAKAAPEATQQPVKPELKDDGDKEEDDGYAAQLVVKGNLDIMQRRNALELQSIDIQKKRGELVPTQGVLSLVVLHSESIKTAYMEASDNLIVILSQKHDLSAVDIADIRKQLIAIVNASIDNAIDSSKKMLKGIVKEYSVKRGVGQHD